jgi:hypothetical protein
VLCALPVGVDLDVGIDVVGLGQDLVAPLHVLVQGGPLVLHVGLESLCLSAPAISLRHQIAGTCLCGVRLGLVLADALLGGCSLLTQLTGAFAVLLLLADLRAHRQCDGLSDHDEYDDNGDDHPDHG